MDPVQTIRRMFSHASWADAAVLDAVRARPDAAVLREYAHVLGAAAVWLARIEQRPAPVPVWPELGLADVEALRRDVAAGWEARLARIEAGSLGDVVAYTNSAGQSFRTPLLDILVHVALHGQYHRGKVNLLLRQAGAGVAPVDYVGFVRGVPAAVTPARAAPPVPAASGSEGALRLDALDHVHVFVANRAAAERWYADVLRLVRVPELSSWADDGGPLTIADATATIHLALFERPALPCRSTIAFSTGAEGFLAWRRHLDARLSEPAELQDHETAWSLYFSDPDGNPFEIVSYDHAALAPHLRG